MSFSRRVFIAVFLTALSIASGVLWLAQKYVDSQNQESFVSRYTVFSKVLGDTLTRQDIDSELLMKNAAKILAERDAHGGTLESSELKRLRDEINVTHLFVVDAKGNFIRSTNEAPNLIPNAFGFCPAYKKLYGKVNGAEATPLIQPMPEPKPYKFLYVPSKDKTKLLEVALRVDFVAQTLTEALKADSGLMSLSLFSPLGTPLGKFSATNVEYPKEKVVLPDTLPTIIDTRDTFQIFSKVQSSHPKCCQCDVSGSSKNGEYYYVLESRVSKKELKAIQAASSNTFLLLLLVNIILAFAFSKFITKRIVKNIESAVKKVRKIKESGSLKERIGFHGSDEVGFLTNEFDRLLDSLEKNQEKLIEADRAKTKMQVAKEVAHNIRSPIVAVEMILPFLAGVPENFRKIIRESVKEIKGLSEKLDPKVHEQGMVKDLDVCEFLMKAVSEKKVECMGKPGIEIRLEAEAGATGLFVQADPLELKAVISNLVNNAVESYEASRGEIFLTVNKQGEDCQISINDQGKGIPPTVLSALGEREITHGKANGRGIGLFHAHRKVASWGGRLSIRSKVGQGTSVDITLPGRSRFHRNGDGGSDLYEEKAGSL